MNRIIDLFSTLILVDFIDKKFKCYGFRFLVTFTRTFAPQWSMVIMSVHGNT